MHLGPGRLLRSSRERAHRNRRSAVCANQIQRQYRKRAKLVGRRKPAPAHRVSLSFLDRFRVEMDDAAYILENATSDSLVSHTLTARSTEIEPLRSTRYFWTSSDAVQLPITPPALQSQLFMPSQRRSERDRYLLHICTKCTTSSTRIASPSLSNSTALDCQ